MQTASNQPTGARFVRLQQIKFLQDGIEELKNDGTIAEIAFLGNALSSWRNSLNLSVRQECYLADYLTEELIGKPSPQAEQPSAIEAIIPGLPAPDLLLVSHRIQEELGILGRVFFQSVIQVSRQCIPDDLHKSNQLADQLLLQSLKDYLQTKQSKAEGVHEEAA